MKCLKSANTIGHEAEAVIHIGGTAFTLQDATEDEVKVGNACLGEWQVVLEYDVQVCGPGISRPYYDKRYEVIEVGFDELIFAEGECVGIYHEEMIFLFTDESTHRQKKYLGEFIVGPDRTYDAYDHYVLKRI